MQCNNEPMRDPNVISSLIQDGFTITNPKPGGQKSTVDPETGEPVDVHPTYSDNPVLLSAPPPEDKQSAVSVANADDVQRKLRRRGRLAL